MKKNFYAILLAAGNGLRMGNINADKLFMSLCDVPVFFFSILAFLKCDFIKKIIIAVRSHQQQNIIIEYLISHNISHANIEFVIGGNSRTESAFNALQYMKKRHDTCENVVIHDAARPFVQPEHIKKVCDRSLGIGAAVLAKKTTDTVVARTGNHIKHLDRSSLWNIETPQAFDFNLIFESYKNSIINKINLTDDSSAIPGTCNIEIVEHFSNNIKITYHDDITVAENFMKSSNKAHSSPMRVGIGYDIHKLVENRKLILGGIEISHKKGLLGHSDADVLIHAIADALLGAACLPDIGILFPDIDENNKDISSEEILQKAIHLLREANYIACNVDCVIIAQEPILGPYTNNIKRNLAKILNCNCDQVNVKVKSNERCDSIGNGEAIAVHVNALISKIN